MKKENKKNKKTKVIIGVVCTTGAMLCVGAAGYALGKFTGRKKVAFDFNKVFNGYDERFFKDVDNIVKSSTFAYTVDVAPEAYAITPGEAKREFCDKFDDLFNDLSKFAGAIVFTK